MSLTRPGPTRPTLVTGCSSGIGRAIALRLAREGWPVYASARRIEAIADLADHGCELLRLDVTDEASRRAAVARIESDYASIASIASSSTVAGGAVGALVNNAGFGQQGPLEETPLAMIRAQFETNVFGAVALCQAVLPGMRRAKAGRIVNLSSMGGRLSFPGGAAYHGSKYALEAMTDVLRFEVAGFGIGVILVEPGPTTTDFGVASLESLDALPRAPDGAYDGFRAGIRRALESTFDAPGSGASTPEDVAEAVWTGLSAPDPEPRIVVGELAHALIARKEAGTTRDWDEVVAEMYPRPGVPDKGGT